MFTGIVEELGEVLEVSQSTDAARITIGGQRVTSDARHGDSIAVNGVCLTVVDTRPAQFTADVMRETLRRSNLALVAAGDRVNLERAAALGDRLGGHLVQGHVDGTATVLHRRAAPHWELVRFSLPSPLARYVIAQGSIAVDGVSLTVAELTDTDFTVGLIPTTLQSTTLGTRRVGDQVNLEVDLIAKYVERLTGPYARAAWEDNARMGAHSRSTAQPGTP